MNLGQNIDIVSVVKSEIDRRVGEFYLAKSRLNRVGQLVNAMQGKVEQSMVDKHKAEIAGLKTESVYLTTELGKVSAEASKPEPDYLKLSGALGTFTRMDKFVSELTALEADVEGKAKGAGIPLEPFNWLTIISLGLIGIGLLSRIFPKKR